MFDKPRLACSVLNIQPMWISAVGARKIVEEGIWIPRSTKKIDALRREMLEGRWCDLVNIDKKVLYKEVMIFTDEGILWEGKHRMWALAMCKDTITCQFAVILGWPKEKAPMLTPTGIVYNDDYGDGKKKMVRINYLKNAVKLWTAGTTSIVILPPVPDR